jgi:hypothetical protein
MEKGQESSGFVAFWKIDPEPDLGLFFVWFVYFVVKKI